MTTTANLSVTKIDSAQAQKEVTANQAFDVFDSALTEIAIAMTDANYTLSTSTVPQEWQYGIIKITGTLTANRDLICPTNKKHYIVVNGTTGGFTVTLKTNAGTGIAVSNGVTSILRCDGTNVVAVTPGAGVGSGTVTSVNITQPAAGITASGGPITSSGSITLALADDLAAVEGLSATGIVRRTASNTWSAGTTIATSEITDDAVTYAKIQNVSATDKLLGRSTAGAGDVEEITCTAFGRSILDDVDAAAVRSTIGAAATEQPFDMAAFYPGIPTASAKILRVPIARSITFAANFSGSQFNASANATASTVFDVQKNGSSIGSVTIGAGGITPTFATTSGTSKSFVAGDVLSIIAPASADATLADPGFTLVATR